MCFQSDSQYLKELAISRYIEEKGIELYNVAEQQKLEGVVAKRKGSIYHLGKKSSDWIKFKILEDEDFVVCGYIPKENHMTSLIIGQYKGTTLLYKGHVTLGVSSIRKLKEYDIMPRNTPPFDLTSSGIQDATWLEPTLVCVVEYMPNNKDSMRQPIFKGFRLDKAPMECQC